MSTLPLYIEELRVLPAGTRFLAIVAVRRCDPQSSPAAGQMLRLECFDRTGSFQAVLFSNHPKFDLYLKNPPLGPVRLRGTVDFYAGSFSPKIDDIAPMPENDEVLARVQKISVRPVSEMRAELELHLATLSAPVRAAVAEVLQEAGEAFFTRPAALGTHHNYRSGLIEHTLSTVRRGRELYRAYATLGLSEEVVVAALILHDTGKVAEYSDGTAPSFQLAGILQGHISLAHARWASAAIRHQVPAPIADNISHCILSHHGEREFGSPITPHTMEAWVVHLADLTDSKFGGLAMALAEDTTSPVVRSKYLGDIVRPNATAPTTSPAELSIRFAVEGQLKAAPSRWETIEQRHFGSIEEARGLEGIYREATKECHYGWLGFRIVQETTLRTIVN